MPLKSSSNYRQHPSLKCESVCGAGRSVWAHRHSNTHLAAGARTNRGIRHHGPMCLAAFRVAHTE